MPRQPYGPNGQNLTDNFSMTRSRVQLFSTVMCISDHALPATRRLCAYALQKKNSISLPANPLPTLLVKIGTVRIPYVV